MTRSILTRRQFLGRSLLAPFLLLPQPQGEPASLIQFAWSGAVTPTSATVKAKTFKDSQAVRLVVSPVQDLSNPLYSPYQAAELALNNRVAALTISNLTPNTLYYYGVEVEGVVDQLRQGTFRTFPEGAASFMIAFGSCAETGSAHPIFELIRSLKPLFFMHTGDMHYRDIKINDRSQFRAAFEQVLASPTQSALYRSTPLVYTWDDHDYGPNDSTYLSRSRPAARLTYQEYVPHYPLAAGSGDIPIYHAFTAGRVRFIVTDLRSERSAKFDPDDASKSMLGAQQKAWLKQELLEAKNSHALIIWVSSVDWLPPDLSDGWHLYSTEREELANFIKANGIRNLAMIAGDLHMLGIDNGSHADFAEGGGAGFPIFQASPLDRFGFEAEAPYSEGRAAQRGQFGIMNVIDDGGATVRVEWSGRNWQNEELLAYSFTVPY
jgi:phosphodiesterase/alkaline phosphatase D-like protein